MNIVGANLFPNVVCGGLAAAGFGVLFNFSLRTLPWCAASGAFAVAVRTLVLTRDWSVEAASFFAALAVGFAVLLLPSLVGISRGALHVVGCIPLIPGAFAAKAILGFFTITTQHAGTAEETLVTALASTLHVLFTIGALGTGLAVPTLLLQACGTKRSIRTYPTSS